jgi:uncharacterized protein
MTDAAPVEPSERIQILDILRGFALFGVLAANIKGYSWPAMVYDVSAFHTGTGFLNGAAEVFLLLFIRYKSATLLSFLFGLGFYIQMTRAESRGSRFGSIYVRRNLVLLAFGILHIVLLWWLDILSYYAIAAFVLLAFRKKSLKSLKRWIIGFAVLTPVLALAGSIVSGDEEVNQEPAFKQSIEIHQHGTYGEILRLRLHEYSTEALPPGDFLPTVSLIMVFILMGTWAGRARILHEPQEHLTEIRKAIRWGLILGAPAALFQAVVVFAFAGNEILVGIAEVLFHTLGLMLFLTFAGGIVLLVQNKVWESRLKVLAPLGRMTLTTYLTQSLICTTIFNGYGLGLYGRVGPAAGLLLTIGIYTLQVFFSRWWLSKFQFGPMEWLWRALTYGYPQGRKSDSFT